MSFLQQHIDRSIIVAQFDLRGYLHPLGFRMKNGEDNKGFTFLPANFVYFAAGNFGKGRDEDGTHEIPDLDDGTYEEWLQVGKDLAAACDSYSHEAVQYLLKEVILQTDQRRAAAEQLKGPYAQYVPSMESSDYFGKVLLTLAEAFDVAINEKDGKHIIELNPKMPTKGVGAG